MSGLMPNNESGFTFKGKTHTNLVVSEGNAPAHEFTVSRSENVKFSYEFGPEGNQNVVIAKGKAVQADGTEYHRPTNSQRTALKTAEQGTTRAIGINHHNLYERKRGRQSGGNQGNPTIIPRSLIELPLFEHDELSTAQGYAAAMQYGSVYSENAEQIREGDFVKVGSDGNITKLDTANDNAFQAIGQVWGAERELPPKGFLQYFLDIDNAQLEEFLKQASYPPSPGAPSDGSAGAYPMGQPYSPDSWKAMYNDLVNPKVNRGIPFLTDGYFRSKQQVSDIAIDDIYDATDNNDGHIENVTTSGDTTISGSTVTTSQEGRNHALFVKLRHDIDRGEADPIAVKYETNEGTAETPDMVTHTMSQQDQHVDFTNNTVVIYLEPNDELQNLTIDAKLQVDPVAGIPTEWDYAGSVGAVQILLNR